VIGFLIGVGSIILPLLTFIAGRAVSESEKVLGEKRRVYEAFLVACPRPNDAYENSSSDLLVSRNLAVGEIFPSLLLYAAPTVAVAANRYLESFADANEELVGSTQALHPAFKKAAQAHNDLILEMRRDALAWSAFGYRGESRLPKNWLEEAKRNSL